MNNLLIAWILLTPIVGYLSGIRITLQGVDEYFDLHYRTWMVKDLYGSLVSLLGWWAVYFLLSGLLK